MINPLWVLKAKSLISPKNIAILLIVIFIGFGIWKVNSIINENGVLKADIAVKEQKIEDLTASVEYRNEVLVEIKKRVELMEKIESERDSRIQEEKQKSKKYSTKIKADAEKIKTESPEKLDEFYATKYNDILECIQNVTEGVESKC